jgi:hypothetical protein
MVKRKAKGKNPIVTYLRAYACACGGFHLGKARGINWDLLGELEKPAQWTAPASKQQVRAIPPAQPSSVISKAAANGEDATLTRQETATLLQVSLPYLEKLVEAGTLSPIGGIDNHPWVFGNRAILKHKAESKARQEESLTVLVELSESLGLYHDELVGVPVRHVR